jgi:hypothetical protein
MVSAHHIIIIAELLEGELFALNKKSRSVRPFAPSYVWHRLAAKCLGSQTKFYLFKFNMAHQGTVKYQLMQHGSSGQKCKL